MKEGVLEADFKLAAVEDVVWMFTEELTESILGLVNLRVTGTRFLAVGFVFGVVLQCLLAFYSTRSFLPVGSIVSA